MLVDFAARVIEDIIFFEKELVCNSIRILISEKIPDIIITGRVTWEGPRLVWIEELIIFGRIKADKSTTGRNKWFQSQWHRALPV